MTATLARPFGTASPVTRGAAQIRRLAPDAAVLAALAWWGVPMTHAAGGRDGYVLATGLLVLMAALTVIRPWRVVRRREAVVALGPALAAGIVCLTAPTGWSGIGELASFTYAGVLYLLVRAYARTGVRRTAVAVAVALVGLEQFEQSWLAWWGSQSVTSKMIGTFYWHNPFAAFLLGCGLVAGVAAVRATDRARGLGWVVAPVCFAGVVLSTSRTTLALAVLLWLIVVALSFRDRVGRLPAVVMPLVTFAVLQLLTSRLVMAGSGSAATGLAAREADQSMAGNGGQRLALWRAALGVWRAHPWTGAGFHSFAGAASWRLPAHVTPSTYAHNGFLQAAADGGILLAVTVGVAALLPLLVGIARVRSRANRGSWTALAAPIALAGLIAHSAADFDWSYPSLLALAAVLAALAVAAPAVPPAAIGPSALTGVVMTAMAPDPIGRPARSRRQRRTVVVALYAATALAVAVAARSAGLATPTQPVPVALAPVAAVVPVHGTLGWLPSVDACRGQLASGDAALARRALACTMRAGSDDPWLQMERATALASHGDAVGGIALARATATAHPDVRSLRLGLADAFTLGGAPERATAELTTLRAELTASPADEPIRAAVDARLRRMDDRETLRKSLPLPIIGTDTSTGATR